MNFLLFLMQNWRDMNRINDVTGIIGNQVYKNLTPSQIETLIKIAVNH
jgi:hypothetical protein